MSGVQQKPATWPIPTPAQLFSNAAAIYEAQFPGINARSANSVASTNARLYAMGSYDRYLMQANLAQELMPDTAVTWLAFHANIWGVPRLQPTPATGNAVFSGAVDLPLPSGIAMTAPSGALYMTTAAGEIGSGGTVSLPIVSALGGSAYNVPGGTTLSLVSPISGLTQQTAVLDSNGAANGTDLESIASWRSRILAKIRQPPQGGALTDYQQWALDAGAAYVNVVPQAVGPGSVGIYIAAAGPTVASSQLVTAVQDYIGVYGGAPAGVRPVTAYALVGAATLVPQNLTLHLNPDTELGRAAATAAATLFFQQVAQIGAELWVSKLDGAIAAALGTGNFDLVSPSADVTCTPSQMLTLGTVTFV